jgi:hypothetical protein
VDLVSIVGAKWARYASIESKEGCSQSSRSVMWEELATRRVHRLSTQPQCKASARFGDSHYPLATR